MGRGRGRGSLLIHGVAFTLSSNKLRPTIITGNHPAAGGKSLFNFCFFNPFFFHTSTAPKFTNPNPNPKRIGRDSLQQFLLEKCKCGFDKLDDALVLFDRMLRMRPLPSVIDFNRLLAAIAKMKHYSVVVSLFRYICALTDLVVPVDIVTITTVINCCCHCNRVDYGFSLLGGIFKRGLVPNVFTYTTLIRGLLSENKFLEAEELFKKLIRTKEIEPNAVMYGTIINGLCKEGKVKEAEHVVEQMIQSGENPNVVTYSALMHGYCLRGEMYSALAVLNTMMNEGIVPDDPSYSILINGYCKNLRVDEAMDLFRKMLREGLKPTIVHYSSILHCLFKMGRHGDPQFFLNEMQAQGHIPSQKCLPTQCLKTDEQ